MKTRRGVVRGRTPKERGGARSWGEDSFLPPKQNGARAPAPQGESARKRAKPRHLGASSPSGNVRGGCRGWTPRRWTIPKRMNEGTNVFSSDCFFLRRSPTEPPFSAHSIFKKSPPRKRKSMERRKRGEGGAPRLCEALVGL